VEILALAGTLNDSASSIVASSLRSTPVGFVTSPGLARLDFSAFRRGSHVLSGSPAAAIGEIVKRLTDGLVVSVSNWPVARSLEGNRFQPDPGCVYPSLPPCAFRPSFFLPLSYSVFLLPSYLLPTGILCTRAPLIRISIIELVRPLSSFRASY